MKNQGIKVGIKVVQKTMRSAHACGFDLAAQMLHGVSLNSPHAKGAGQNREVS
jgi:hypothetical protein